MCITLCQVQKLSEIIFDPTRHEINRFLVDKKKNENKISIWSVDRSRVILLLKLLKAKWMMHFSFVFFFTFTSQQKMFLNTKVMWCILRQKKSVDFKPEFWNSQKIYWTSLQRLKSSHWVVILNFVGYSFSISDYLYITFF